MENTTSTQESPARRAAVAGLAVVGFFALVFIGMVLAIFAARFVPKTANGFSSAAAYLSSVFTPDGTPATLTAVPTTTVPFPVADATSTVAIATTTMAQPAPAPVAPAVTPKPASNPIVGTQTTITPAPINSTSIAVPAQRPAPYGLPNLAAAITAVGFIAPNGQFIPSNNVLNSEEFAIQFTITNAGTNVSGPWDFAAVLPTKQNRQYTFNSAVQPSLNPGDHVDYTLHLDPGEAANGYALTTSVTADPNNRLQEITKGDNVAVANANISNQN